MKNAAVENWRNQTLVNRVNNDATLATEYYVMVKYVVENYKLRFETIQNPLLHLMSHCLEIRYKETLQYAADYYLDDATLKKGIRAIIHKHDLPKLCTRFVDVCNCLQNEICISDEGKNLLKNTIIPENQRIASILKSDTTAYRYTKKISRKGDVKGRGCPILTDDESPNIQEVYPLFENCNISIAYVLTLLENICPGIKHLETVVSSKGD